MAMFKVQFFIDDGKLGAALRALAGTGAKEVDHQPMANAEVHPKTGKTVAPTNGTLTSMFEKRLRQGRKEEVTGDDAKDFLSSVGRSPLSYSYLITEGQKAGFLKRVPTKKGERARWTVLPKKGA